MSACTTELASQLNERTLAKQVMEQLSGRIVANKPFTEELPSGNRNFLVTLGALIANSYCPRHKLAPEHGSRKVYTCHCSALPPSERACSGMLTLCPTSDGCGTISFQPHCCGSSYALRLATPEQRTRTAGAIVVTRPVGGHSRVSLDDGVIWSSSPNASLESDITEITTLRAKLRLLDRIRCNLFANRTVVLMVPMARLRAVSGTISELQRTLHDVTGNDVVVLAADESRKRPARDLEGPSETADNQGQPPAVPQATPPKGGGQGADAGEATAAAPKKLGLRSKEAALLFAVFEVTDEVLVSRIRAAVTQVDTMKLWVLMDRHKAGDEHHKVNMVGLAYVHTDKMCMYPGYAATRHLEEASFMPGVATAAVAALAEAILDAAASKFPSLNDLRARYIKQAGQALLLGRSPFNLVAKTENQGTKLHLDTGDGPLSIILWLPHGEGRLRGGHFCVPALGIKFLPLNCTMVVIAAGVVLHGTVQPERVGAGSSATRVGMSAFLRTKDVHCLAQLAAGAGSLEALQAVQHKWNAGLAKCKSEAVQRSTRDRAKAARDRLFAKGAKQAVEVFDEDLWAAPKEAGPVVRKNLLDWVQCC